MATFVPVHRCADCKLMVVGDELALERGWRFYCSEAANGGIPDTAVCERCVRARKFIFGDLAAEVMIECDLAHATGPHQAAN